MKHAGIDLVNRLGAARAAELLARVEWGLLSPATLRENPPMTVALLPPVVAGLILFRLRALIAIGLALAFAIAGRIVLRLVRWRCRYPVVIPAVTGVALVGAGAPLAWLAAVPFAAVLLEVLRGRFLPAANLSTGLIAYAAALFASTGALATYLRPLSNHPAPEPISLWLKYVGGAAAPVDPVKLYVGNVAGPLLATSLLAVVLSIAWLWYSDAIRLPVLAGFLVGGLAPCLVLNWNAVYQLDSGPAWFVVALVLADRRLLRHSPPVHFLMGLIVGLAGVGLRSRGVAIEGVFLAVLGAQLVVALTEGAFWLGARRRVVTRRAPGLVARVKRLRLGSASGARSGQPVQEK